MRKFTLFLFTLFTCLQMNAQIGSYSFSQTTETYAQITGTTSTAVGDDGEQNAIPIGFNFNFGGTTHTTFSISTNGIIKLGGDFVDGTDNHWTNSLTNGAQVNKPLIAVFWDDNNLSTGTITYSLTGSSPNQVLSVNWHNTKIGSTGGTGGAAVSAILRLYETTNVIEMVYSSPFTTTNTVSASVGLNDATSFLSVTPAAVATVSSATANNGINATVMANLAGKKLIFTPPALCTGTPTSGTVSPSVQTLCTGSIPANLVGSGYSSGVSGLTFQWEESNDDGVGDAWANAVGGSGATTPSYTPPAFSGTTIYYRLNVTCSNSALSAQTVSVSITPPANPSNQVTALTQGTTTLTTIPLSWTNGNGGRRVVYFNSVNSFTNPVNGNAPALTAAAAYVSGEQIVYDGTGTGVTVTGLTSGTTYYVKVYEYLRCGAGPYDYYYNVSVGSNVLTVTPAAVPINDNFVTAIPIACGNNYTGSTSLATLDEANPALQFGVDLDAPNVWYSYTGTGTPQTVTLNLCGSSYDTSVLVFTGTSGALTAVAGNDDDATCGASPADTRSRVSFNSNGTTTYYIVIEGWNATSVGTYTMDVTCVATNPPAVPNQDCGTALLVNVDGTDTNSDNSYGTVSPDQPTCDLFGSIQDVWFKFVAPVSGTVDCLITNGTMTSLNFNVYSGASCAGLTAVAGTCNANLTVPTTESLTGLVSGDTYYVQVWSNAAEQGTFTMKLSDALVAPSFDKTGFTVYPNPVKDVLNLSYTRAMSNVSIHNLLGQTVMSKNINGTSSQLDLSRLANGTYLVKVTVDDLIQTIKIVKE